MNREKFREMYDLLMEQLDVSRELSDDEILGVIDELILTQARELFLSLKEKVELRQELADCQNNGTSDETYDNCYSQHTFPIFSGCVLVIFTKLLADNDGSSVGKTATGDGTNVYHHNSNGICGNHIIANVAKDRCER